MGYPLRLGLRADTLPLLLVFYWTKQITAGPQCQQVGNPILSNHVKATQQPATLKGDHL